MLLENKKEWNFYKNEKETEALKMFLETDNLCKIISLNTNIPFYINYLKENVNFDCIIKTNKNVEEQIRSNIKITFRMTKYAYEGEVTEIRKYEEFYEIDLMTIKETKKLTLPKILSEQIKYLRIGDVIYAEPSLGVIRKLGRSERVANEFDLEGNRYLPVGKTTVCTEKEKEILVSLKEIDDSIGNKEKSVEFIRNNQHEFKNILMLVDTPLNEFEHEIIKKYAEEFDCIKFIYVKNSFEDILTLKLENSDLFELIKHYSDNKITDECVESLKNKLKTENLGQIIKILSLSATKEEFLQNLNKFI